MSGTHSDLLDVAVIGGSQAGLAMAWHLSRRQLRFVVLDAAPEIGHTWRCRWDSLTLFTPAQYNALPGMPFPAAPPTQVRNRSPPTSRPTQGFEIGTQDDVFHARQVVVATGPFQVPSVPQAAQRLDGSVTQLHSSGYRSPQALPPGQVLVVGGGNSGFQIAEELAAAGRQVGLSSNAEARHAAAAPAVSS
jgi:putative flavoprotein involved in K+ transport